MEGNKKDTEETTVEHDAVVEEIKEDMHKPGITLDHLKELSDRLDARMDIIAKDRNKDAEEKAELHAKVDKLQENIERLIQAQEEKERKHNDETTMVVPPPDLDPPTHQNTIESGPENAPTNERKPRKGFRRWY